MASLKDFSLMRSVPSLFVWIPISDKYLEFAPNPTILVWLKQCGLVKEYLTPAFAAKLITIVGLSISKTLLTLAKSLIESL